MLFEVRVHEGRAFDSDVVARVLGEPALPAGEPDGPWGPFLTIDGRIHRPISDFLRDLSYARPNPATTPPAADALHRPRRRAKPQLLRHEDEEVMGELVVTRPGEPGHAHDGSRAATDGDDPAYPLSSAAWQRHQTRSRNCPVLATCRWVMLWMRPSAKWSAPLSLSR